MRIAIAISKLDRQHGGAESWTIGLADWLANRGHEIHLVGHRVSSPRPIESAHYHLISNSRHRLRAAEHLTAWLAYQNFDIVHDMGIGSQFDIFQPHCGSLRAQELRKRKSMSMGRRLFHIVTKSWEQRQCSIELLSKTQFSHPTANYIAVSSMVARDLASLESIPASRIFTISNGVDIEHFNPIRCAWLRDQSRVNLAIDDDSLVISIIAHNHQLKGVPQILALLQEADHFPQRIHCLVVGGHRVTPRTVSLGKHTVTYTGAIADTLAVFAATDVYVHPTFYDACCLSVLEAMACGLPSITTRQNGAAERIAHGKSGFLIDTPHATDQLLQWLYRLIDPVERFVIGNAARENAETWTISNNYLGIEEVYRQYIAKKYLRLEMEAHNSLRFAIR